MRRITKFMRRYLFEILDVLKFVGILILIFMFINFSTKIADNAKAARETTQTTQDIVSKQDETLKAIQQLALDNRLQADQKTNIIICMLKIPVSQRTTDIEQDCRKSEGNHPISSSSSSQPVPNKDKPSQPQNTQSPQNSPTDTPPNPPAKNTQPGLVNRLVKLLHL